MSDLISRQAAIKKFNVTDPDGTFAYCSSIIKTLKELPPADRAEGYWIGKPIAGYATVRCSNCGDAFLENSGKWNYCPTCGADMRETE